VSQDVIDQRDQIVADLEAAYPVVIETFTATEQEAILRDRYTDPETGEVTWPEWYTPL